MRVAKNAIFRERSIEASLKFTYYAIRSLTITRSFILCASYRKIFQRLPDPYYVIPASSAYSLLYGETKGLNTLSFVSHFHVHE